MSRVHEEINGAATGPYKEPVCKHGNKEYSCDECEREYLERLSRFESGEVDSFLGG